MNDHNLIQQALVTDHNGLLPHPVSYAQVEPSRLPMTAQALRRGGYRETQYRWLHIPTGKSGVSTVWVSVERCAGILVEYWDRIGVGVWKYSLVGKS